DAEPGSHGPIKSRKSMAARVCKHPGRLMIGAMAHAVYVCGERPGVCNGQVDLSALMRSDSDMARVLPGTQSVAQLRELLEADEPTRKWLEHLDEIGDPPFEVHLPTPDGAAIEFLDLAVP